MTRRTANFLELEFTKTHFPQKLFETRYLPAKKKQFPVQQSAATVPFASVPPKGFFFGGATTLFPKKSLFFLHTRNRADLRKVVFPCTEYFGTSRQKKLNFPTLSGSDPRNGFFGPAGDSHFSALRAETPFSWCCCCCCACSCCCKQRSTTVDATSR